MEKWRKIPNFDYEVSNFGRVRGKRGLRKLVPVKNGYLTVILRKDGKSHCKYVHRLVAEAFIPTKDIVLHINHKDKDRHNNRADNLEWCTPKYNVQYSLAKPVDQFTLDGLLIRTWSGAREAERTLGYHHGSVDKCASGKFKQTHGFIFRYKELTANE